MSEVKLCSMTPIITIVILIIKNTSGNAEYILEVSQCGWELELWVWYKLWFRYKFAFHQSEPPSLGFTLMSNQYIHNIRIHDMFKQHESMMRKFFTMHHETTCIIIITAKSLGSFSSVKWTPVGSLKGQIVLLRNYMEFHGTPTMRGGNKAGSVTNHGEQ